MEGDLYAAASSGNIATPTKIFEDSINETRMNFSTFSYLNNALVSLWSDKNLIKNTLGMESSTTKRPIIFCNDGSSVDGLNVYGVCGSTTVLRMLEAKKVFLII